MTIKVIPLRLSQAGSNCGAFVNAQPSYAPEERRDDGAPFAEPRSRHGLVIGEVAQRAGVLGSKPAGVRVGRPGRARTPAAGDIGEWI